MTYEATVGTTAGDVAYFKAGAVTLLSGQSALDVPVNFSVATSKFTVNASTGAAVFSGAVSGVTSLSLNSAAADTVINLTNTNSGTARKLVYEQSTGRIYLNNGGSDLWSVTNDGAFSTGGNVSLGVTLSPWSTGKAIELGYAGSALWADGQASTQLMSNMYYNAGNKFGGTGYAGVFGFANGDFQWYSSTASGTAGNAVTLVERMRIDAYGNFGLGLAPSGFTTGKFIQVGAGAGCGVWGVGTADTRLVSNLYYNGDFRFGSTGYGAFMSAEAGSFYFYSSSVSGSAGNVATMVQKMHLDEAGRLNITASTADGGVAAGAAQLGANTANGLYLKGNGSTYDILFLNNAGNIAGSVSHGATTITTSSDERLKENLAPITNAVETIKKLRTVTGNYIADPDRNVAFLIAQDVDAAFPQAVDKANPDSWGVNYNWTIPLAMAAIKELAAKLAALEAKPA